jgi:anaerobic selenocysteine-containing dehydrogenase
MLFNDGDIIQVRCMLKERMIIQMMEPRKTEWKETRPWRWEEDGYTVTRGAAWSGPGCHDGCGVLLYTKNDQLVKVEGDLENPFNQGRLCVRCLSQPNLVYHPDRLKYPLKRTGKRGENKWERISWDEAYDTIEREFNKIKEVYGPEAVIFGQGTGRDIMGYISRLAYSFGSPNWTCTGLSGLACYLPRVAGMMTLAGTFATVDSSQYFEDRYDNPQWKPPACIAIWGNNPLVANADGFFGHWTVDCMKRGTKLIVVDPRLTWLASRADLWLQIRPGTDAALALGMLNVIIQEGLYDKEFVDKWTYGFEKLAERAAQYPVERVSQITWIPKDKIIAAARMYAQSKPAATQWGLAIDMTKEALPATQAISALWTITGNLDVPGGMITVFPPFGEYQSWLGGWGNEMLSQEAQAKRIGLDKYPILGYGFLMAEPDMVTDAMLTEKPYPVKGAWLQTNNPLACMSADPKKTYEALSKLDFVVVVDLFMTPTAVAHADIVLPAAAYPERDGLRTLWYYIQTINKTIQVGECKSDMQINLELGKRFNPQMWPWKDVREMFDGLLEGTGLTFEQLRERGTWIYPKFEYKKYEKGLQRRDGQMGFDTPTGRIELYSTLFEKWGQDPLPYFEEPTESPYSTPEVYKDYPLVLTTGARPWPFFHSEQRQVPNLRSLKPDPQIEIHPTTAAKYGIQEGNWVWIENDMGRCKQRAKLTPGIDPRVVNADHAWWFPEQEGAEPNLFGVWKSNINLLVPQLAGRIGFGGNYKSLLCKIYKVAEGEM